MSMGYAGWFAYVLTTEDIKNMATQMYNSLETVMLKYNLDLDKVARHISFYEEGIDVEEEYSEELIDIVDNIKKFIYNEYNIVVDLCYTDPDNGDIYDEISGSYWWVDFESLYIKTDIHNDLLKNGIHPRLAHAVSYG